MDNPLDDFSEIEGNLSRRDDKFRHGCTTSWLVLMLVANSLTALTYMVVGEQIADQLSGVDIQNWMLALLAFIGISNVFFAVLIFKWKKLGFWGFVGTTILANGVNLYMGLGIGSVLSGLVGVGVLYAVLQLKSAQGVSAWECLE